LACGGITNPDAVGDEVAPAEAAPDEAAPDEVAAAVAVDDPLAAGPAAAVLAAAAEAAACADFLPFTADMLETSSETASARPTISVMTGVGIFMPGGTQRARVTVQPVFETL
jgi:hypothetical protein